jgi:lipopolysaccharide/colanic/teichoic acid biosynthesis glycosyltransferase
MTLFTISDATLLRPIPLLQPRRAYPHCPWMFRYPRSRKRPGAGYRRGKRLLDICAVMVMAPLWIPLWAVAVLAIKVESPGAPAHFAQRRTGAGARPIRVFKLRTMVPNAEELKASLMHLNLRTWPDFKVENDPRVTRVGRILRMTSLDELPQLFNVLRGDMSLVGPRPTSLGAERYDRWQLERFDVPPGITGLWQIAGRALPSFEERLRLDLTYVDRRCLRLDLEILVRTLPAVIRARGAC